MIELLHTAADVVIFLLSPNPSSGGQRPAGPDDFNIVLAIMARIWFGRERIAKVRKLWNEYCDSLSLRRDVSIDDWLLHQEQVISDNDEHMRRCKENLAEKLAKDGDQEAVSGLLVEGSLRAYRQAIEPPLHSAGGGWEKTPIAVVGVVQKPLDAIVSNPPGDFDFGPGADSGGAMDLERIKVHDSERVADVRAAEVGAAASGEKEELPKDLWRDDDGKLHQIGSHREGSCFCAPEHLLLRNK